MTIHAEVAGPAQVEMFGRTAYGNMAANIIVPCRIEGRTVPVMFQSGENDVVAPAHRGDGYQSTPEAWGLDAIWEISEDVDLSEPRRAAQAAFDAALAAQPGT